MNKNYQYFYNLYIIMHIVCAIIIMVEPNNQKANIGGRK